MEYLLNCVCTFVKFLAFGPNLMPKHLRYLFVTLESLSILFEGILPLVKLKGVQQIFYQIPKLTKEN